MIWRGKTVICIGSGPSLNEADCEAIKASGMPCIAVNNSWELAPFCSVIYAGDCAWWEHNIEKINVDAQLWTCSEKAKKRYGVNLKAGRGAFNSGMRAIELAISFGAKKILLVGYDCSVYRGIHWHGKHEKTDNPDSTKCTKWRRQFAMLSIVAKSLKVEILNCSRETAIESFPRVSLEKCLEHS